MEAKKSNNVRPGNHETEICYGGEADLSNNYAMCRKNKGHKQFIPLNEFNLNRLPFDYRDVLLLEVIKALAAITVLIKVKYTSLKRPKSSECFGGQYPCYENRGSDVLRTGTGRVLEVVKYTDGAMGTCSCGKCRRTQTTSTVWGEIHVLTAAQVVFNNSEARKTTGVLGYDGHQSTRTLSDSWKVRHADIRSDRCIVKYQTCDEDLLDELASLCQRFNELCSEVKDKYYEGCLRNLTVIVSHPHGCPKKISVGQRKHKHIGEGFTNFTYTSCTCPGSSGAQVYMPGYDFRFYPHIHSGSNSRGGFSGEDWIYKM